MANNPKLAFSWYPRIDFDVLCRARRLLHHIVENDGVAELSDELQSIIAKDMEPGDMAVLMKAKVFVETGEKPDKPNTKPNMVDRISIGSKFPSDYKTPHLSRKEALVQWPLFLRFYAAYPVHIGKKPTWREWAKLAKRHAGDGKPIDDEFVVAILAKIELWKGSKAWREGFIIHPRTWVYRSGWEDDIPPEIQPLPETSADYEALLPAGRDVTDEEMAAIAAMEM